MVVAREWCQCVRSLHVAHTLRGATHAAEWHDARVTAEAGPEAQAERLLEAGRALVAELDLEVVLERLLETARELTGARYAAIGVLDAERRGLERFLTSGIDAATHAAIGDLPRGRGVLGLLIDDPRPLVLARRRRASALLRLPGRPPADDDVPRRAAADPRRGLGQPLPDREGGRRVRRRRRRTRSPCSPTGPRSRSTTRACTASPAQRSAELERAVEGLEATTAIARALGSETDLDRVLELIVKRGRALVRARTRRAAAARGRPARRRRRRRPARRGHARRVAAAERGSVAGEVLRSGRPERIADVVACGSALQDEQLGVAGRGDRAARAAALPRARARRAVRVRPARRGAGVRRPRRGAAAGVRGERRDGGRHRASRSRPSGCATACARPSRSAAAGRASCTTRRCRGSPRWACCSRRACARAATRSSRPRARRPSSSRPRSPTCAR